MRRLGHVRQVRHALVAHAGKSSAVSSLSALLFPFSRASQWLRGRSHFEIEQKNENEKNSRSSLPSSPTSCSAAASLHRNSLSRLRSSCSRPPPLLVPPCPSPGPGSIWDTTAGGRSAPGRPWAPWRPRRRPRRWSGGRGAAAGAARRRSRRRTERAKRAFAKGDISAAAEHRETRTNDTHCECFFLLKKPVTI